LCINTQYNHHQTLEEEEEKEEEEEEKKMVMMMMMMIGFSATVSNTMLGDICQLALHCHCAGHFFFYF
jgi:hypothetical protein